MDLENQKRVKDFAEQYGPENIVVVLGAAEGEASGLAAETVTAGEPTFAGPLPGVQTKHSVEEYTTSAPAVLTHSSIAGPGTPSLSPMMITFLPFKRLMTYPP